MVENLQKLMEAIKPGFGKRIRLRLAGLATGSVCMMADTDTVDEDPTKQITPEEQQMIKDTDGVLRTVVKAASILTEKGSAAEKTNRFREETNLDMETSYRVMLAMDNLKPDNKDLNLSVNTPTLVINDESPTVTVAITKENKSNLQKAKSDTYHALEPEKIKMIEGRIVQLEHFDDMDLKFGVLTEKDNLPRVYPVHYDRKYDNRVKQSKGESVKVKIERGERRQWFLAEWL